MKELIIGLFIAVTFMSCSKEDECEPEIITGEKCYTCAITIHDSDLTLLEEIKETHCVLPRDVVDLENQLVTEHTKSDYPWYEIYAHCLLQ